MKVLCDSIPAWRAEVRLDLAWKEARSHVGRVFDRKAEGELVASLTAELVAFDLFLVDLADWVDARRWVGGIAWGRCASRHACEHVKP
jgi:hypothetical protein